MGGGILVPGTEAPQALNASQKPAIRNRNFKQEAGLITGSTPSYLAVSLPRSDWPT